MVRRGVSRSLRQTAPELVKLTADDAEDDGDDDGQRHQGQRYHQYHLHLAGWFCGGSLKAETVKLKV